MEYSELVEKAREIIGRKRNSEIFLRLHDEVIIKTFKHKRRIYSDKLGNIYMHVQEKK